jgi:hypothetical protein
MTNNTRTLDFSPAGPVAKAFMQDDSFIRLLVGPLGSGKTSAAVVECLRRAQMQRPGPDGRRHVRIGIIRNTVSELKSTTIKSWEQWCPPQYGKLTLGGSPIVHKIETDELDLEVLFVPLDKPDDVRKLLSLELTFAWIDECREIQKEVLDALTGRVGRYPSRLQGGCTWSGIMLTSNPSDTEAWLYALARNPPEGYRVFRHPDSLVERFKFEQADAVTGSITREHKPGTVFELYQLGEAVRRLPNQLFLQAFATWHLIFEVMRVGALYYVQRYPEELGDISWTIDRKDRAMTQMEETWSTLVLPMSEKALAADRAKGIAGEDYSHYERRYGVDLEDPVTAKHLQWLQSAYGLEQIKGRVIDVKRLLTEQRKFEDSRNCLGLQLADMLASTLRRAFNDRLRFSGWKEFGQLLVRRQDPANGIIQLGPGPAKPLVGRAKQVCKVLDVRAKSMLVERIRKAER